MSRAGVPAPDVAGALLDALSSDCGLGFAVHGEDLRLLRISPALAELSGLPAEEQLGRRLDEVLSGDIAAVAEGSIREVAETGRPLLNLEPALEVGRPRGWLMSVYPVEHKGRRLVAVLARDVTERRRAEAALRQSRELLSEAQRMAGIGSWSWDLLSDRWTWSDELFRLAGLDPVAGAPPFEQLLAVLRPESREAVRAVVAKGLRDGRPYEVAFAVEQPDGSHREFQGRGIPEVVDGRVVRVDGFAQDVTGLRGAERRQRTAAVLGHLGLSGLPIDALLRQAADAVVAELGFDHAMVTERVEPGWIVRALDHDQERVLDGEPVVIGTDSLTQLAQAASGPVLVEDWQEETRLEQPAVVRRFGIRSSVAIVIGTRDAPLGVLSAHARAPRTLDAEELAFLQTVAATVALASQRMRLEDEVAEQSAARGRLLAQALDAEDRARRAISEALHDGPLQDLLVLGHDVSRLQGDPRHLERARDGIARAVRQIREVMLDLHPVVLQVGGLESALNAVCAQQARAADLVCHVRIDPAAAGRRDELVLSLARELLRNVAKHADAREVTVEVRDTPAGVRLTVTDDGRGIEPGRLGEALGGGHIGLASGRERAEAVGGRLSVGARPDGRPGTHAAAILPAA